MRFPVFAVAVIATSPTLAQFPPPGIYACVKEGADTLGTLSLLVAGDYAFDGADGTRATGQIASAATSVEAVTGPLADQHWRGEFSTEAGATTFVFETDGGKVTCR